MWWFHSMADYSVVQGADIVIPLQITTDGVTPSTAFTSADVLSAVVWIGTDQAVLFTPALSWIDAEGNATFQVAIAGSQTATVDPGIYKMQILVGSGGQSVVLLEASLEIKAAPDSGTVITADISYYDLTLYVPQIRTLYDPNVDLTDFLNQRHEAQQWFRDMATDRYRPQIGRSRRYMDAAGAGTGSILTYGPDPMGSWDPPSIDDLLVYFAAGGLVITESIRQCQVHYAASIIYLGQPGRDNVYVQAGEKHRSAAMNQFQSCIIEFDTGSPPTDPPTPIIRVDRDVTWLT